MRGMGQTYRRWLATGIALLAGLGAFPGVPALGSADRPPAIVIRSPKPGAVVHTASVAVTGSFTVAPVNGPSPKVSATLDGRNMQIGVDGPVKYDFRGKAPLHRGGNRLTVVADDGDGGESSKSVSVSYVALRVTRRECVEDRRGDSHDRLDHMDIVGACARRRGGRVLFSVTTAKPPPKIHDSFGNPTAPCIEILRGPPGAPGPAPIQSCGDAQLRGWKRNVWPKVPFSISGRISTWKVPLKYLPRRSFRWRAYLSEAEAQTDDAPDKGYLKFVVRG